MSVFQKPVFWFAMSTGFAASQIWGWWAGLFAWATCSFLVGLVVELKEDR